MKKIVIIIGFAFSILCNAQTSQDSIAWHQSLMNTSVDDNNQNLTRAAATASTDGSFYVGGNSSTYYPVVFQDNAWGLNKATVLELGRSNVHGNSGWNGSLIASFKVHVTRWGHQASFIDADIKQLRGLDNIGMDMIGGWADITGQSNFLNFIIWLRGGATYYYHANCTQSPIVSNGSVTVDGKTYDIKTKKDDYVNSFGETISKNLWVFGGNNYFKGNVGIGTESAQYKLDVNGNAGIANNLYLGKQISTSEGGEVVRLSIVPYRHTGGKWDFVSRDTPNETFMDIKYANFNAATFYYFNGQTRIGIGVTNPKNKLDVAGVIRAEEVKIEAQPWADFVFDKDYQLPSLDEVKAHIDEHKHLPNIPSEKEVQENGIGLGEMQAKLLQKIEELTLYVIQQDKAAREQNKKIEKIEKENILLKTQIIDLKSKIQ